MSEILSLRCDHCDKEEAVPAGWAHCTVVTRQGVDTYDFCPDCWAAIHAEYVAEREP